MIQLEKIKVNKDSSIRKAIKIMDDEGLGFIYIVNEHNEIIGVVSDGDFRRAILNSVNLDASITSIMNKNFIFLNKDYEIDEIKKIFKNNAIKHIPILEGKTVIDIITEESIYGYERSKSNDKIDLPVVIMAGGLGTRLNPFTRILPKPLIPIGEKTILEIIIDKFRDYGVNHFYLSVNNKSKIIKSYFEELAPNYKITYLYEDKPLGTAGSLRQLYKKIKGSFILTNCDVIIKTDYNDIIKHHFEKCNDITLVVSLKYYNIPYGICKIEEGGSLIEIEEKPEYVFLVNTGMYIIKSDILKYIPENELFHITNLIEKVKSENGRVGVYPVNDSSWIDVGEWIEYKKAVEMLKL